MEIVHRPKWLEEMGQRLRQEMLGKQNVRVIYAVEREKRAETQNQKDKRQRQPGQQATAVLLANECQCRQQHGNVAQEDHIVPFAIKGLKRQYTVENRSGDGVASVYKIAQQILANLPFPGLGKRA